MPQPTDCELFNFTGVRACAPVNRVPIGKRENRAMCEKRTIERAHQDAREGKAPSTQAGEFVREEMEHIREGKHGARNTKQAIAIGLSKARRAGVKLPPNPKSGKSEKPTSRPPSAKRSRATSGALKREGRVAASKASLSRQARSTARARGPKKRQEAATKAVRTKGAAGRKRAAQKGARTRAAGG